MKTRMTFRPLVRERLEELGRTPYWLSMRVGSRTPDAICGWLRGARGLKEEVLFEIFKVVGLRVVKTAPASNPTRYWQAPKLRRIGNGKETSAAKTGPGAPD
ncbi:MAG: hypothetical protein NTU94_13800 [Planctomycetota bacterium]|nr:hypothetical protein [Planctomycetota bacterium]